MAVTNAGIRKPYARFDKSSVTELREEVVTVVTKLLENGGAEQAQMSIYWTHGLHARRRAGRV